MRAGGGRDRDVSVIRAAGGLVWRHGADGQPEVCLIHRERYHDWALPKGKLEAHEHPLEAALREVTEETGVRALPQMLLARARYRVGEAPKIVDYWAMYASDVPTFQPGSEVDALAWLPTAAAVAKLTYPQDAQLVQRWERLPALTSTVLLVRHAHAGERGSWHGPDHARGLTPAGSADAQRLSRLLALFAPAALVSASPHRCVQTLAPLADACGLPVVVMDGFDEQGGDPDVAAAHLSWLAASHSCTVVCSQGGVIGPTLASLTGDPRCARRTTAKSDGWLLPFTGAVPLAPVRLAMRGPATAARSQLSHPQRS